MGGEAGGVAEALRPRGAVLLDGTGLRRNTWQMELRCYRAGVKNLLLITGTYL